VHTTPHPPQSETPSIRTLQPEPSQFPRFVGQGVTLQVLAMQLGVPPAEGHTLPHAPQSVTVLLVCASQPLATLPSQFWNPASHARVHTPALQLGTAWFVLHAMPHAPQFVGLLWRSVSQPLVGSPSQSP
jgi:hypothetical protein